MINDAMSQALEIGNPAPVHINVQLSEPLGRVFDCKESSFRSIKVVNSGGYSRE